MSIAEDDNKVRAKRKGQKWAEQIKMGKTVFHGKGYVDSISFSGGNSVLKIEPDDNKSK